MDENENFENNKMSKKKLLISVLIVVSIVMSGYMFSIGYGILLSEKIYSGISIEGIDVGGLSKSEASAILEKKYKNNVGAKTIYLVVGKEIEKIDFENAKVVYNYNQSIDKAYNFGRNGTLVDQFVNRSFIKADETHIPLSFSYDKNFVSERIEELYKKVFKAAKEFEIIKDDNKKVYLKTGFHGEELKKEEAIGKLEEMLKKGSWGSITIGMKRVEPKNIEIDELLHKIVSEPKNASTEVINNEIIVLPEEEGRQVEKSELVAILAQVKQQEDKVINIPIKYLPAKLKTEEIKPLLLRDELGTFTTQFYTGDVNNNNRKHNIILAASKLDGVLLGAGKVFSFNNTVGPRSSSLGYRTAHSYVLGKIVDSAGGGICQVSTTLYNAVLLADVSVEERNNHIYTVGYVPLGRDAAVSYDDCDFKFKNTTNYPLKITCWVSEDNKITFSLIGTNEAGLKTIDFRYENLDEFEARDKISYDSSMPAGEQEVTSQGMKGYVVKAYKIVKEEGNDPREVFLGTSEYRAYPRQITVGTGIE